MPLDDLNIIRQKIKDSIILSSREKEEWLYLLPRMTKVQLDELVGILAVKLPAQKPESSNKIAPPTLPPPRRGEEPSFSLPLVGRDREGGHKDKIIQPAAPPLVTPKVESRLGANLEHIDALNLADLRKYPTSEAFMAALMEHIHRLIEQQEKTLAQVFTEFEKSPLYRTYLQSGLQTIAGNSQELLSQAEFEAIADFRSQLRRKINS